MENLYLYEITVRLPASQSASDLKAFQQQDLTTRPGCINRVLLSTLR